MNRFRLVLWLVLTPTVIASAQERPNRDSDIPELIRKLAEGNFKTREAAERRLLDLGSAALPDLLRGAKHPDVEVRRRCERIIEQIPATMDDALLIPFLTQRKTDEPNLPGWRVVRSLLGDDDASRSCYADLYRSDRKLLDALEGDQRSISAIVENRVIALSAKLVSGKYKDHQHKLYSDAVAVLVGLCSSSGTTKPWLCDRIKNILAQPSVHDAIIHRKGSRALVELWLDKQLGNGPPSRPIAELAERYHCEQLLHKKLKAAATELYVNASKPPSDPKTLKAAVQIARHCGCKELIDQSLSATIRANCEFALRDSRNLGPLFEYIKVAFDLQSGVSDELRMMLKPLWKELIEREAAKTDLTENHSRLGVMLCLLGERELMQERLNPPLRAIMIARAARANDLRELSDFGKLDNMTLSEELDTIVAPAAAAIWKKKVDSGATPSDLNREFGILFSLRRSAFFKPVAFDLVDKAINSQPDLTEFVLAARMINFARQDSSPKAELLQKSFKEALAIAIKRNLSKAEIEAVPTLRSFYRASSRELAELSIRLAADTTISGNTRGRLLSFLETRGGAPSDLPAIERLLSDATTIDFGAPVAGRAIPQVRDAALCLAICLSEQKTEFYDFSWYPGIPPGEDSTCLDRIGFDSDEAREAAHQIYRESRRLVEK